jgi:predicted MFS family arabinose efflux permease
VAFSLVYAVSSFGFGRAADRGLRRNVIIFGLIVWSLATAASGLATGFVSLFAARVVTGIGEASLFPAGMSLLAERMPVASRGRALGIFGAAAALGGGLGVGLGGALAESLGWRQVFFIYGFAGLLLVPVLLRVPERIRVHDEREESSMWQIIASLVRDLRLMMIWMAGLVMMASAMGYSTWLPSYFVRERGLSVTQSGLVLGLSILIGGMAGSVLGGFLADRGRRRRLAGELDVSALAALIAAPIALGALSVEWLPLSVCLVVLAPVAIFAYFPSMQTMIVEIVPPHRHGLAYAVNILFVGGIGYAIGPFVVGMISDRTGDLGTAVLLPVAGMLVASALITLAGRIVRGDPPRPRAVAAQPESA